MKTEHAKMKPKDEPSIRKYLRSVLEADGYHVETVSNGKDSILIVGPRFCRKPTPRVDLKYRVGQGEMKKIPHPSRLLCSVP